MPPLLVSGSYPPLHRGGVVRPSIIAAFVLLEKIKNGNYVDEKSGRLCPVPRRPQAQQAAAASRGARGPRHDLR